MPILRNMNSCPATASNIEARQHHQRHYRSAMRALLLIGARGSLLML